MECEAHSLATARPTPDAAPVMRAVALGRKTAAALDILTTEVDEIKGMRNQWHARREWKDLLYH